MVTERACYGSYTAEGEKVFYKNGQQVGVKGAN